jgi:hypothetical protein
MKRKLLNHLRTDLDFNKFDDTILQQVVYNTDLNNYILDKKYQDVSFVVIDDKIINLDEIYFLCRDFNL